MDDKREARVTGCWENMKRMEFLVIHNGNFKVVVFKFFIPLGLERESLLDMIVERIPDKIHWSILIFKYSKVSFLPHLPNKESWHDLPEKVEESSIQRSILRSVLP